MWSGLLVLAPAAVIGLCLLTRIRAAERLTATLAGTLKKEWAGDVAVAGPWRF
jgi:hypothetical protein